MSSSNTTWRDFTMILAMLFFIFVIWMIPHLNPPASEDQSKPPGNVIAHIVWPNGNIDIDMWLTGPGEIQAVGFSHKSGLLWNLLRDDTGTESDLTGINYENAYTRGVPAGEYVINVQCYQCAAAVPVLVKLEVGVKTTPQGYVAQIIYTEATLVDIGEEITMVRFKLDKTGKVVEGSINYLFTPLAYTDAEGN